MKKQKTKLQKRYDGLSLVERNAYEQIVKRNTSYSEWLAVPYLIMKYIVLVGLLFISISFILGVPIVDLSETYLQTVYMLILLGLLLILLGMIHDIFEYFRINKLKRKLLKE